MRGSLYGRRQAIDLLAELVAEGWLEVTEAGGGRGLATVYRLPMRARGNSATAATDVETVQPAPRKGAVAAPERVQPAAETVQPGVHPNGVPTVQPTEVPNGGAAAPPAVPSIGDRAAQVVRAVWDTRKAAGEPTPANFVAARKVVERVLAAGWPDADVQAACLAVPTISTGWLEGELRKRRSGGRPPLARKPVMANTAEAGSRVLTDAELWGD